MSANKKSKIKKMSLLEVGHEMAQGLYDANIIDATTMREFEVFCLLPVEEFSPHQIKQLRLRENQRKYLYLALN